MSSLNPPTRELKEKALISPTNDDVLHPNGDPVGYDLRPEVRVIRPKGMDLACPFHNPNLLREMIPAPEEEESILTTDAGVIIENNEDSLKIGPRGPTLIQDMVFIRKMMRFDHEMMPERVVHARGSGAHGMFVCTRSMKDVTMASFLSEVGKETLVSVRFSQVVGSKGSPDTVRDVRGFATKFYTDEGNYDLVGNDIPVFFIQDAIKFPDLVHAIKPSPDREMPQASGAHDNFWDFIANTPESAHMIVWLLSDIGVMRSYRRMQGHSVNTFKFINSEGKVHLIKLHWNPHLEIETMTWNEAQRVAGEDIDYLRRDLWEALSRNELPKWDLTVQLMPIEDQHKFEFDPLDPTKVWPEDIIPQIKIGELVLTHNPSNFWSEVEQIAFHPGNLIPGIDVSDDPLLQGRLFSYHDTQLNRFRTSNWEQLPINRPVVPVRNNNRAGIMRDYVNRGTVSYEPNSIGYGSPMPAEKARKKGFDVQGFVEDDEYVSGRKIRSRPEKFRDHFSQATLKWNSMSDEQKDHLVGAFHFELGHVKNVKIRRAIVEMFRNVSDVLADRIAQGLIL